MKALKIEEELDTPKIHLNPETNIYLMSGKSLPENAIDFYSPIIKWLEQFCEEVQDTEQTYIFDIRLDYFNSASSRQIVKCLQIITNSKIRDRVQIVWRYDEGDFSSLHDGQLFSKIVGVDFEFVEEQD